MTLLTDRRSFLGICGGAAFAAVLPFRQNPGPKFGYILDKPKKITCVNGTSIKIGDGSEFFFAYTREQEAELLALTSTVPGLRHLWFDEEEFPPSSVLGGVVLSEHSGSKEYGNYSPFACVILCPDVAGHPALQKIRDVAERYY